MKAFLATFSSVLMALLASMGVVSTTSFATVLPEWAERLGWTLVHSVWQLALIAIVVALISTLLRKCSARVQYACHVAAFITMAVLPCVTWTLIEVTPRIIAEKQSNSVKIDPIVVVPGVDRDSVGGSPSPDDMASIPFVSRFDQEQPEARGRGQLAPDVREFQVNSHDAALISTPIPSTNEASEARQPTRWEQLIVQVRSVVEPRLPLFVALWFVGVVFCSLRPIWGLWTQWRLRSVGLSQVSEGLQHSLADLARRMGVTRVVGVAQSACVTAPMVVGYLKPMILLPASVLTGLTPDQLESLLAHELAHVRRHDWLVNAIQVVVETLLFYHPAVWWLSRRIRDERELCCDDIALAVVGDRATYGRMLLALEELRHTNPLGTLVTPATMAATGGSLVARIRRLMPVPREMERTQRGWLSGAVALLVLAVSCGVWYAAYATAENADLVRKDESTRDDSTDKTGVTEEPPEDRGSGDSASGRRSDQVTVVAEAKVDPTADALRHIARQRVGAKDWPQWCGSNHRNNTPSGRNIPTKWDLETGENVLWKTEHGRGNLSTPVVANGKVFVGGNNLPELVKRYPKNVDLGCLRAYAAETGEFLWQATHSKLSLGNGETDRSRDWPMVGICSPPTVEGTRLWYVSNRSEVVCLDTEGFRDGKNDGPIVDETDRDPTDADFIWRTDLVKDFGVVPHYASASSVLCVGERCFVITSNGVGEDHQKVVNPEAPSFVCLDKNTGKVLWTDNAPGGNILAGSWSSPCAFEINGETQIVMAGGDGWLYSFTPEGDGQGHAKLLWRFDANPKESRFLINTRSLRNSILATPVFYDGLVYVGVGENPEHGEGVGRLWCINPTKRGDVSQELAVDANDQPLPPRRIQVVDRAKGERAIPNPNSAAVWCYTHDVAQMKNGKPKFEGTMHRTLGNVAIKNGLLFIADFCGLLHCLDAKQTTDGQPVVYWTHDMFASVWGTPLIVEDKVYICDNDGDVLIFALSETRQLIAEPSCIAPIETTPIVANDTLYITAQDHLIAIRKKQPADPNPKTAGVDPAVTESSDAQMLAWALVVDGTLADSVAKLGSNELPQQGAYRVIRLDAARLRQSMFDPAVQDHVYSELQPPQALRLSSRVDDRQNFHWSPFFQMKQNIGSVSGLLAAEYVVFPGTPFDIQFQHSSLSIHAIEGSPPPSYELNQKSLNFRGDMPIGSAVAFIAKAQSKTGKQDFREVLVFEAVPKLSEQAERLLRDVTWFKAGRAREREALRQAVEFNSRATRLPDEIPPKWTKPLPHGGSVSLVALARPATHPFCWWDPDGKPCATDWSLQQHAFGTGELIALVCIRDPDRTDFERQGVSYMMTGRNPPLPLYRPWNDAAPKNGKDDSELFLFSVNNTDDEQRPMIGVNSGVGPWSELGKLPMKEEVTYGRADYILGGMNREPDQSVYRSLGRRYLPDEDIRLRLIDKQGKSHPFHPSMIQSNVSDTRGIPFGWDGWSTFETQQVKEKDLDHIVLDARARHWTTFSSFATELNNSDGSEPPKLTIAPPVAPVVRMLSGRLGSRFNAILRARYSSFLSDDDRAALVDDLKRFTERHQPTTLTADRASLIVNGLDEVLRQNVDYLSFFPMYQTLKWRLWMALQQRNLSPDELARREEQRQEIRKLIRAIPIKDFHITRTHGHAIGQLEQWFEDPWHGWFYEPMSDEQLLQWKRDQKNWTINDVNTAASNHNAMVMQVKQSSMKDNPHLGTGALPLDAEVIASLKPGLLRYQTRYYSAEAFYGTHDLVFDEAPKPDRRIFDWSKTFVDLPETVAPGLEAVQKWAEENKTGLLAYESARHGLFMLRGAKLGLLPVETWHEADRLSDDELFRIVGEQAKDSILLADHYGPRPKERGYGAPPPGPLLVVESTSGEVGVLRVKSISNSGITAHLRVRPGAKRKVVAQAEVKAITVGMTQTQITAIKGKHYRKTVGQRAGQVIHVYDDMAVYYEGPANDPKSSLIEKPLNPSWQEALKETAYADTGTLAPGEPGLKRPRETPGLPSQGLSPAPATQPPADPKEKDSTKKEAARKDDAKEVRKRVVRVVDEDKQPIVGARVNYLFENDKSILSQFTGLGQKAETDKKGEFSEEIPEGAERVMITVRADGFGAFSETQGADVSTVVTMKRGRVVHVRAVDGEGKILKQAVPLLNEHRVWGREFVQQKDGTLKSPSVSMNRKLMRVAAVQDAGPMLFSELIDVSTAKPGEDGVLQLTLTPGTRIEGKLDDSVPRPVTEGYVELCLVEAENHTLGRPAWMWNDFTPVKPDGTFVFDSVPGGGHAQIHVLVDGYISKTPTAESLEDYMLKHKLADEKAVEKVLDDVKHRAMRGLFVTLDQPVVTIIVDCEKTASCDFLLLDPSGRPVPDVEVRFNPNGAFTFGRQFNPINLSYESLLVEELHKHQTATWNWNASLPHGREAKQQHDWMNKWIDRVKSDAEGRVRVRNLPGRGRENFQVEAKGYVLPVSPLLNDKDIAKRSLNDDSDRYGVVELVSGETVEKTIYLERKQPVVVRELSVIDANGKPLENVEFSVAEMRVGKKEWQTWSTQRFGELPKGTTDKSGRVVLRIPSQIDKKSVTQLRLGINFAFKDGLWLHRQMVEVPLKPDDGVIALHPNPEAGRIGRAVYGKLDDLLAKSSPTEWLDVMIKGPNLAVLRKLLAASKVKHPEPIMLLDDGRRGSDEKGSKVKVISTGDTKFAIVQARVRPMGGALANESDPNKLPECAFVFDMEGTFIAALGGKLGTTRSNDPEDVDIVNLGPNEDWFVRVRKFENNGTFEHQTDYYRIANPIIPSLRYFHFANSNGWSNGPEKITRWGTLYFDFPSLKDKFDSPGYSDDGGPAQTAEGVLVNRKLIWDGDRNRFVGAAAQFGKGKGLYEVDLNWSKEFEAVAPKPNQLFVTGGEREYDHWHNWHTVVPDKYEMLLTITIPQAEGEPKVIEKKLASGKRHIQVQLKPNKDNTSARLELRLNSEKPEVSELPIQLGDRPEKHPPITQLLNPGDSARLIECPLKSSTKALIVEIKLPSTEPATNDSPKD